MRERAKKRPSGKNRDRRKKKALAGPRKPAKNKRTQRGGIVAAARRRAKSLGALGVRWTRRVDRRADRLLRSAEPTLLGLSRDAARVRARWSKRLSRLGRPFYTRAERLVRWAGRRVRPLAVLILRALGLVDRLSRRTAAGAARLATRASAVITPQRATCGVIVASAACLIAAQFVDYRGVEVGEPGYAGLPGVATAPEVGLETPIDAHSFALIPVALLAAALGILAARRGRSGLGRIVFVLGALSVGVVLLVDMPAGLDAGAFATRFSGADAVLTEGFYAQLASAGGMMLGGLLLAYAPRTRPARAGRRRWIRARKPRPARTQGGLARERTSRA
jgi:hypothetical protein